MRSTDKLPFQIAAINAALHRKRMLINLPAGSGKTRIALEVAHQAECKRILIICPNFLRINWEMEIAKWFPKWRVDMVLDDYDAESLRHRASAVAIVGYTFFERHKGIKKKKNRLPKLNAGGKAIKNQRWDIIICDESHYLRKWDSTRCFSIVHRICRMRERLLFMSATPLVTSAADLHPTLSIMQPGKWGTVGKFKEEFCIKKHDVYDPRGFRYVGIQNASRLKMLARDCVFTAKKKDILKQLPEKSVIDVSFDLGKKFAYFHDDIEDILDRLSAGDFSNDLEEVKTERERVGLAKVPHVLDLLETFGKKEQVVIFAWHKRVLAELTEALTGKALCIRGAMTESKRMDYVKAFQEGRVQYLIASIAVGGLGLNLQCASIAVFAEKPLSYSEFEQCSDRVHRLGSTRRVRIYNTTAQGSLDDDLQELINRKQRTAEAAGVAT